jgi:hypothetical protein
MPPSRISIFVFAILFPIFAHGFGGQLRSKTEYYPDNLGPPTETLIPRVGIELEHLEKTSKTVRFSFKGTFDSNIASHYAPENYFGDIQEAYLEYRKRTFKFRAGYNVLNWGLLDGYSPMDVVNQHVYFNPFDSSKRGAPIVELQWNPSGWEMSAIYLPVQSKPIFPSKDSRWLPRQQLFNFTTNQGTAILPDHPDYDIGRDSQIDHALNNNFGFNIKKQWSSLDVRAEYFEGASPSPTGAFAGQSHAVSVVPQVVQVDGTVVIKPVYYRTRTTGLGFSATTGSVILRGESVYQDATTAPNGQAYSDWSWQSGVGLEKTWSIGSQDIQMIVHYYTANYPHSPDNLPTSYFRLFDDTAVLGLRAPITDDNFFYGSVLYNILQEGLFWTVGWQTKIKDAVRFDISYRDISAGRPGLLKSFDKNDHGLLELVYFF